MEELPQMICSSALANWLEELENRTKPCRRELAREPAEGAAYIHNSRAMVYEFREQARFYSSPVLTAKLAPRSVR